MFSSSENLLARELPPASDASVLRSSAEQYPLGNSPQEGFFRSAEVDFALWAQGTQRLQPPSARGGRQAVEAEHQLPETWAAAACESLRKGLGLPWPGLPLGVEIDLAPRERSPERLLPLVPEKVERQIEHLEGGAPCACLGKGLSSLVAKAVRLEVQVLQSGEPRPCVRQGLSSPGAQLVVGEVQML